MLGFQFIDEGADAFLADLETLAPSRALMDAADHEVAFLQAFTAEMRPPVRGSSRTGGTPRPAHEGHWADVSRALAAGFQARVGNDPIKSYPYRAGSGSGGAA